MQIKDVVQNYSQENLISLPSEAITRFGRGSVEAPAISPDGNMIAVASRIGLWIYNAHTEDFIRLIAVEGTGLLSRVTFSPDSTQVATGDWDGIVSRKDRIKSVTLSTIEKREFQTYDKKVLMDEIEQKVLNALPNFVFKVSFETWVYRITVNMILEYQRSLITPSLTTKSKWKYVKNITQMRVCKVLGTNFLPSIVVRGLRAPHVV